MALDAKGVSAKRVELEKAQKDSAPASAILKILNELKSGMTPTEKLLRETKIGVAVNRLKQNKDPNVVKLAHEMVVSWRNALKPAGKASGSSTPQPNGTASPAPAASPVTVKSEKKTYQGDPSKRNVTVDKVSYQLTGNNIRDSCLKLMYDGLALNMTEPSADILEKAREVELAAYNQLQPETSDQYRNKMRSLFQNLKNKSNPQLRVRVMKGEITPEKFITMTGEELKSADRRAEEERLKKENVNKAMVAQEIKSVSNALRCGKCGQNKVSYTQAQTRSADEPMTTFCECLNCGARWKFS